MLSRRRKGKPPRPGNAPMTAREWEFIELAKTSGCVPCLIRVEQENLGSDLAFKFAGWDHFKSGNFRRGHLYGCACCDWHHQGHTRPQWSRIRMVTVYGPSKHYGSVPFNESYGSDNYLILWQFRHLGYDVDLEGGEAEVDRIVKIVRG